MAIFANTPLAVLFNPGSNVDFSVKPEGELSAYERNKADFYKRHAEEKSTERAPCPSCSKQMRATEWEGIRLFDCDKCRGLWVDERQLTALFQSEPPEELINPKVRRVSFYKTQEGRRSCPKCRKTLKVKKVEEVPIERCEYCKGAWLEHGEFHALRSVWLNDPDQNAHLETLCSYCDLENKPSARRCEACGAPLAKKK